MPLGQACPCLGEHAHLVQFRLPTVSTSFSDSNVYTLCTRTPNTISYEVYTRATHDRETPNKRTRQSKVHSFPVRAAHVQNSSPVTLREA
eukprot:4269951-Pleurochrysis_carterae.AAC.1